MAKLDENYFKTNSSDIQTIEEMVGPDEQILWRGKPKKRAYLINAFTKMLPIALIWLIFDGGFIGLMIGTMDEIPAPVKIFMAVFFLFHLAPVWGCCSRREQGCSLTKARPCSVWKKFRRRSTTWAAEYVSAFSLSKFSRRAGTPGFSESLPKPFRRYTGLSTSSPTFCLTPVCTA